MNTYPAFSSLVGTMQYIFAKENCLLDFIKYFLIKLDLSHCVSGATIPHIYFKDYGKERIPVPSIDVQQSIVDELDKINQLISLKKAQLIDYDNLAALNNTLEKELDILGIAYKNVSLSDEDKEIYHKWE